MSLTVKQLRDSLSSLSSESDDCIVRVYIDNEGKFDIVTISGPYKRELLMTTEETPNA